MYRVIRQIHLYCGLVVGAFLMMYFVSGYIMVHRPWFLPAPSAPTVRTTTLAPIDQESIEQLAADAKKQLGLRGRIQFPQAQAAGLTRFWVLRPGVMARVDIPADGRTVKITTQRAGLVGTLIMLHKIAGYDDQLIFDVYAFFCDLAGVAMILFAISGVYLWWKRARNKTWGILCLAASCAYAAGMMLYLAYAP